MFYLLNFRLCMSLEPFSHGRCADWCGFCSLASLSGSTPFKYYVITGRSGGSDLVITVCISDHSYLTQFTGVNPIRIF